MINSHKSQQILCLYNVFKYINKNTMLIIIKRMLKSVALVKKDMSPIL